MVYHYYYYITWYVQCDVPHEKHIIQHAGKTAINTLMWHFYQSLHLQLGDDASDELSLLIVTEYTSTVSIHAPEEIIKGLCLICCNPLDLTTLSSPVWEITICPSSLLWHTGVWWHPLVPILSDLPLA
jgi:hypothetical protein